MSDARVESPVDERLAESAPLARRLAAELCGPDCSWYHGVWQDLRRIGLITTAATNAAFLLDAFREQARRGARRVLVSACADQSVLAHLLSAFRHEGVEPEVVVVDLCGTPLALCAWYAERVGAKIATRRSDILDFVPDAPFDLVCTHNFMTRFIAEQRPRLVARWRDCLRPGGAIVTVQRVRPTRAETLVRFSPSEAREFAERALALAQARAAELDVAPEAIAAAALEYARRRERQLVRTSEALGALFTDAGFELALFEADDEATRRRDRTSGPPDATSQRIRVVALRRGDA
jgi:SAM-dependent methyltransferase